MIGTQVKHYLIESEIGRGGMGIVYKAKDTTLGRTVALKFLPATHHADDDAEARFVHEAKSISALDHPNVAVVHEIGKAEGGQLYIAMGYYVGETLEDIIAKGPVETADLVDYTRQIASGLQCAHEKGITHRDVKPGNVIVTESGLLKILDFGLAKVHDITMTADNLSVGTPAYISPEQSTGQPFDHRVDLWALGVVMFELLTGERPFSGSYPSAVAYSIVNEPHQDVRESRPDVPEQVIEVMDRLLSKNPDDRFQTAAAVIDALSDGATTSVALATVPLALPEASTTRVALTKMLSTTDSLTKTVIAVVPKKVFGVAARLFYSVAVSLIAVLIGYFFQQRFLGGKEANQAVATSINEQVLKEAREALQDGLDYMKVQQYGVAIAAFERSIEKDSTYSVAWSSMAAAYLETGDNFKAMNASSKAVAIDSANESALYNLGFALSNLGRTEEAIQAFQSATEINPGFTIAYSAWADLLIEESRPAEALDVLMIANKNAEPAFIFLIHKNIGKAQMRLEQYDEALVYLESALSERATWPETNSLLAECYAKLGRTDDAKIAYEKFLGLNITPEQKLAARAKLAEL